VNHVNLRIRTKDAYVIIKDIYFASFNYLGNMIPYEKEMDIDNTLHNYLKITVIINNVFRPKKPLRKQE